VDEAAAGCDLELPFVPRTAHDARAAAERELAVVHLDRCRDPACAERRATVRAAVGECMQLSADAEEPDAVAADRDHPHGSFVRRRVERHPCLASAAGRRRHHGTSLRHAFQFVSSRQRKPTNGTSPPSTIATRVCGKRSKMPWQRIETRCPYMPEPQSVWYSA